VRGSVFRKCWCRNPDTKKRYTKDSPCPKLKTRDHGKWYARYDSMTEDRRQPVLGPFDGKKEAEGELAKAIARSGGGRRRADRSLRAGAYLDAWLAGKRNLKESTRGSYEEAFRLYWKPALGKLRLVDVGDDHVNQVITEMLRVNRPADDGEKPSEMLLRMLAARADDERRALPDGEARHKKSTKPLSAARIERMYAPFRTAMNAAVETKRIDFSPCTGVELPRPGKVKPLAWTPAREAKFREALARRAAAAEAALGGRAPSPAERQDMWDDPPLRPCPVMVWMPAHTGRFLDYLDETSERLAVLFTVAAFCGLRRDELLGLTWAEVDLPQGVIWVLETGSGEGPKSDAGTRAVPIPGPAAASLRAWRKIQAADMLAWAGDRADNNLVFTREDGSPVPAQWTSVRFETLAFRAGLPPVRFHDLRHGTASLLKASGEDTRVISAILGHARTSFTDSVYVTVFPEVAAAAAERAAAIVPRKAAGGGRK
jgi:integrase